MGRNIIDILDNVIMEYHFMDVVDQCKYLYNKYDIDINDEVINYLKANQHD